MDILQKIKEFASQAHADQKRKFTGEPYIIHPVRVMNTCREYTSDNVILAAALLHDVLEDTKVSKLTMREFLESIMSHEDADRVIKLVTALTDVYTSENYPNLNRRRRKSKETERLKSVPGDAQTIKYADIIDNTNDITWNDRDFAPLYLKECMNYLRNMTKGHPELYQKALNIVSEHLRAF